MKKYDFDALVDRTGTGSMKYDLMKKLYPGSDEKTIPLWVADMDFRCSDAILSALHERVDRQIFGYTNLEYDREYYESVAGWFKRVHGCEISTDDIHYCPGIVPAIAIAVNTYTDPGDAVLINRPVYHPFMSSITGNGRKVVNVPLEKKEDGEYLLDMEKLEQAVIDNGIKLYVFCSPHNPVGKVWSENELSMIGEICRRHGVTVFSDEIHADILRNGVKHVMLDSLFPKDDFVITGTAPSKTFNIPGIPLSNIITRGEREKKWIEGIRKVHIQTPGAFVPALLKAAYNDSLDWYLELKEYLDENFRLIDGYLKKRIPHVGFQVPDGTYLGWMDFNRFDVDSSSLLNLFIRKGGFIIQDGRQFGKEGDGFFRVNVGTRRENIEKMLESLEVIMKDIPLK